MVVVVDELCTSTAQIYAVLGRPQVDVLMLESAPEALDEDVVDRATLAIHADPDAFAGLTYFEELLVLIRGELAALVGVDDLRLAMGGYRISHHRADPLGLHGIAHAPAHDVPAVEVDDRAQVHCPRAWAHR